VLLSPLIALASAIWVVVVGRRDREATA